MTGLPRKHGFLTEGDRKYVNDAIDSYSEMVGTKKARHDFSLKMSSWSLYELKQTLEDWHSLYRYFDDTDKKQLYSDFQKAIWNLDSHTDLLTAFVRTWLPPEARSAFMMKLMKLPSGFNFYNYETFAPNETLPAYCDYLKRLRFDTRFSNDYLELENKRKEALLALQSLCDSMEGRSFRMNSQVQRIEDTPHYDLEGEDLNLIEVAYQLSESDIKLLGWFEKTSHYVLRLETETVDSIQELGNNVKVNWRIDLPRILLDQFDTRDYHNWNDIIMNVRSWTIDDYPPKYDLWEDEYDKKKIEISKIPDPDDPSKGYVRCEIAFRYEELEPHNPNVKVLGTIPFDRVTGTLDKILNSKGQNTSNIIGAQNELFKMKLIKYNRNKDGYLITKKGSQIARYLSLGKRKNHGIDCWLSYDLHSRENGKPERKRIDVRGSNHLHYLGLYTYYGNDL